MTASQAIHVECRWCKGNSLACVSKICNLRAEIKASSVKKIRAHCLDCVEKLADVKDCTGEIHHVIKRECPLHPYRFGKNPDRKKRILTPEQLADLKKQLARALKIKLNPVTGAF